uniref:Uncharacterized protein n=1 Tax=Arundo donax TaxID=35708 RepID=A0A0A9BIL7_ARUDO
MMENEVENAQDSFSGLQYQERINSVTNKSDLFNIRQGCSMLYAIL